MCAISTVLYYCVCVSPMPDAVRKYIKLDTSGSPVLAKREERCESAGSDSSQPAKERKVCSASNATEGKYS